jgi:hypothetical protein
MKKQDFRQTVRHVAKTAQVELLTWGMMNKELLLKTMNTSIKGYDDEYVAVLLDRYGYNEMQTNGRKPWLFI